jgi:hypothetical protein
MRSAGTEACSTAPTESRRDACAEAFVPAAKVTMKVTTSPGAAGLVGAELGSAEGAGASEGAGVSEGAGAVGSLVGAVLGSGLAGSEGSGAAVSDGSADGATLSLGDASGDADGSGSVAKAARGDMMLEMNTMSVKRTRTLRVAVWRSGVGTNGFPQLSTNHRQAHAGDRQQ